MNRPRASLVRVSPMKMSMSRGPSDWAARVSTTMVIEIASVAMVIMAVSRLARKPEAAFASPL